VYISGLFKTKINHTIRLKITLPVSITPIMTYDTGIKFGSTQFSWSTPKNEFNQN